MKLLVLDGHTLKLKLSPSFMTKANCPLYLKLNYIDKVNEKYIRVAAMRGSALHEVIAELIEYCSDSNVAIADITDEQLREGLVKHAPREVMDQTAMMMDCLFKWRAKYYLSKYLYGYEEKLALDEDFNPCDWDDGSYRGVLDITDIKGNHCTVTDWKSQANILNNQQLEEHEQLTHYCWLAWKTYDYIQTFTARIFYLRYGFYHETTRTIEQLEAYEQTLLVREQKIMQIDNWDPVPGDHCGYCDFVHLCPLAKDMESNEVISQEQAIRTAEKLTVMDAFVKEQKAKLRQYVVDNDDVRTSEGWIYGLNHTLGKKWDPEQVENIMSEHDHSLHEVANIDVKKMEKLIKESAHDNPVLEMELSEAKKDKHGTRFQGWKPEE